MTSQDGWVRNRRGNLVKRWGPERGPVARGDFPCPMLIPDFDEPVQSMADGKFYGSKSALSNSHKAQNNPHGQDFIELGNDRIEWREHVTDRKAEREVLAKAMADVDAGWQPESFPVRP